MKLSIPFVGLVGLLVAVPSMARGQARPAPSSTSKMSVRSPARVYQPLVGFWKGSLTYRDYTSDKQETLPTTLEATLAPGANRLQLHYVYDDGPGKTVEETDTVTVDTGKNTYRVESKGDAPRTYMVSGLAAFAQKGGGTLVLAGTGEENGKKVAVRNTLTRAGQTLTILHETKLPGAAYRFRNRYQFTRAPKPAAVTRLSARQLQADFAILREAYESLHPGLYRYNTPAQVAANFAVLQKQLDHEQSRGEAYVALATFLAKIECGHTYPNFFNQPPAVVEELFARPPRLPFYFRWIDHRMIVTRVLTPTPGLVPGTEVVALNGVPVRTIREKLMTVSRADGSNLAKRESNLEVLGNARYEAFDVYYPLLFPVVEGKLTAQVKAAPSATITTVALPAMSQAEREAVQASDAKIAAAALWDTPGWEFRFLDGTGAGYLRLPTWALYNSKWDWHKFLDEAFVQLAARQTQNLIIDLRGNEGGLSVGNYIIGKLIEKDLPLPGFQRWVRYRKVPVDLSGYLDTWDPSFKDWGKDVREPTNPDDGFFRMTRWDDAPGGDVIKADAHPFRGQTYVIVGAVNSSATFEFAQAVRQNHLATLVGQPTGGNQRGINGGAFFFLRLPNSKIEVDVPLVALFPADVQPMQNRVIETTVPDAGLTPDVLVSPRVEDVGAGVDTELGAVQRLIRERGS